MSFQETETGRPQLTDVLAHNVTKRLNDKDKIRTLFLSLKMNSATINSAFTNHKGDIRESAHELMAEWRDSIETKEEAYATLWKALTNHKVNLCNIAHEVLGEHPTGRKNNMSFLCKCSC